MELQLGLLNRRLASGNVRGIQSPQSAVAEVLAGIKTTVGSGSPRVQEGLHLEELTSVRRFASRAWIFQELTQTTGPHLAATVNRAGAMMGLVHHKDGVGPPMD